MKRNNYSILCFILVMLLFSGCGHRHKEGEPDIVNSMKINRDETLTVVANREQIVDKEDFAKLLIQKCEDNSFRSIKFSTDNGYATSLKLKVYLWRDEIKGRDPVMVVEYVPVDCGKEYDIVNDPEKFQMFIDGQLMD